MCSNCIIYSSEYQLNLVTKYNMRDSIQMQLQMFYFPFEYIYKLHILTDRSGFKVSNDQLDGYTTR